MWRSVLQFTVIIMLPHSNIPLQITPSKACTIVLFIIVYNVTTIMYLRNFNVYVFLKYHYRHLLVVG